MTASTRPQTHTGRKAPVGRTQLQVPTDAERMQSERSTDAPAGGSGHKLPASWTVLYCSVIRSVLKYGDIHTCKDIRVSWI